MENKPDYFIVNPLFPGNIKTVKMQKPSLNLFNRLVWEIFEIIFDPEKLNIYRLTHKIEY